MQVINNVGEISDFKPKKITYKIMEETGLNKEEAEKIQRNITYLLKNNYADEEEIVSTSIIRSLVTEQLIKKEYIDEEKKSRKLGMSVSDFENLIKKGCQDNANMGHNPEMIGKYSYDAIAKEYALLKMPKECADAYTEGYCHHHDMEYFELRPNCFNIDLRFIARNGLKVDGKGIMGSVAKPAKSLEVLLNHMLQFFMAGAVVFSGGQGYVNFNTLLSPFARGRTYKDIKQAIQGFVYNCNCSLVCRGGQILFSSISLDLSCPDVLKDEPAVGFEGVTVGTYKDYQEEADMIFRAVLEVSDEKDGQGRWHRFPNILFNIREGDLDEYAGTCKLLHESGANNPTLYYVNCTDMERTVMGCRTALPMNYRYNYEEDCCNTGNFMYTTLNLPLIAYESETLEEFYEKLDYYCEIVYKTLKFRRKEVEKILYHYHMSDFLLQTDKETGLPLYDLDRTTFTIGFCGLNEAQLELNGKSLSEDDELGYEIVKFINDKKDEFKERDGWRWSVIASPAESTTHRFAKINKHKHEDAIVQGDKGNYYLTNSSHIPVADESNIIAHIKNADKFHPLTGGGNLLHIWLGEVWSDPEALWKLNQKIIKTNTKFWAYSKVFTYCQQCEFTINDNITKCPICGSEDLIVYDRVTGYYLPALTRDKNGIKTQQWNNGKIQEFNDRHRHNLNDIV